MKNFARARALLLKAPAAKCRCLYIQWDMHKSRVSLITRQDSLHFAYAALLSAKPNLLFSLDILAHAIFLPLSFSRFLLRSWTKSPRQQFPSCPSSSLSLSICFGKVVWFPVSDVLARDIRISQIPLETTALVYHVERQLWTSRHSWIHQLELYSSLSTLLIFSSPTVSINFCLNLIPLLKSSVSFFL